MIALGEDVRASSPSFPLGASTSRGRSPDYGKASSFSQSAPTALEDLPAQRVSAKIRAALLESAILPRGRVSATGTALAGSAAAGQTSSESRGQSPRRPGTERAPATSQDYAPGCSEARTCAGAWSRSSGFFSLPLCDRPGCHEPPATSVRNPARYCCSACRHAVACVLDRERKWRTRGTLDGRTKRASEYQAARWRRLRRRGAATTAPVRPPPD